MDLLVGGQTVQDTRISTRSAQAYLPGGNDSSGNSGSLIGRDSTKDVFGDATKISLSGSSVQALSTDQIVSAINENLASSGLSIQGVNPDDYTPEAVADRILSQVSNLISARAENGDEARQILADASRGIAKGIDQARDILEGLGALNETVSASINDTEQRLDDGLKSLDARITELFGPQKDETLAAANPKGDEQTVQTQITQTAQASQYSAQTAVAQDRNRPQFGFNA
ncbi:DUF5610 domain-containing protein [Thalassospira marina]|uniref:DUF5610 domain-containing protein n=1 Tax=Thalassospira marina TaxID=2048283 RepID=A0A2N3KZL0_9PROT|nr:DUF5610 domain-containing protein [Thalassospira marina]AUG52046.1 hypothetical protein CSC3H3_04395 [Thalassospira marina]PKR55973.1 hypothetical protein COO20_01795 [Thalassospira marina]